MIMTTASDLIQMVTSTTADIDVQASWVDITTTTFTPGRTNTKVAANQTTTIVGSPAGSTQRQIKTIVIRNIHAATTNVITVIHNDNSNAQIVYYRSLLAGESIEYTGTIWIPYNAKGIPIYTDSLPTLDIQVFITAGAGTWIYPTSFTPSVVQVVMWGGGGGGGAGASLATSTVIKGGGGGGGGCFAERVFKASDLNANQSLNVGSAASAGAHGGAGNAGGDGGPGGNSTFGTTVLFTAYGGGGGRGGQISALATGGGGSGGVAGAGVTAAGAAAGAAGAPAGAIPYVGGMGAPGPITVITTHNSEYGGGGGGRREY